MNRELHISLRFWGNRLDPELVTKLLAVRPTRSHCRGDTSESESGKVFVAKTSMWEVVTSDRIDTNDYGNHIAYVEELLKRYLAHSQELVSAEEKLVEFYSSANSNELLKTLVVSLSPDFLSLLGKTSTGMQITLC